MTGCQPWCTDHSENVCMTFTVNEVTLTWMPGEDATVWLDCYELDTGMTLDDAERAAWAILSRVYAARNTPRMGSRAPQGLEVQAQGLEAGSRVLEPALDPAACTLEGLDPLEPLPRDVHGDVHSRSLTPLGDVHEDVHGARSRAPTRVRGPACPRRRSSWTLVERLDQSITPRPGGGPSAAPAFFRRTGNCGDAPHAFAEPYPATTGL